MSNRDTFLLNIGSILSIAWFGIIGALYIELLKSDKSGIAIAFDFVGVLVIGYFAIQCYLTVNERIEEEEEENGK